MSIHPSVPVAEENNRSGETSLAASSAADLSKKEDSRALRVATGVLLLLVVLFYLGSVSSYWHPTPDSALYLMLGKSLAAGSGFSLWGQTYWKVPPGYPAQIALLKTVGLGSYWWQNLYMSLLALVALTCMWRCLRYWTSAVKALLVLAILAGSFTMHHNSVRLLTDVPCMALFWAGMLLCLRAKTGNRWQALGGVILLAGTCFMRVPGLLLVAGALLGFFWESQPSSGREIRPRGRMLLSIGLLLLMIGLSLGSGILLSHLHGQPFRAASLFRPLANAWLSGEELSYAFLGQPMSTPLAWLLLGLPCLLGLRVSWQCGQRVGISILACYLLSFWLLRPTLARYLLPVMPLLFWYYLEGMHLLCSGFINRWQQLFAGQEFYRWRFSPLQTTVIMGLVLLGINLPRTVRSVYRAHRPETAPGYEEQLDLQAVADFLRQRAQPGDRLMSNTDQRLLSHLSEIDSLTLSDGLYKGRPLRPKDVNQWRKLGANYFIAGMIESPDHFRRSEEAFWAASQNEETADQPLVCVFSNSTYRVYTSTPTIHSEKLRQAQIVEVTRVLQTVAEPSDSLAANMDEQQLAFVSGMQNCVNITDDIRKHSDTNQLLDQGASLILLLRESDSKEYWDQVRLLGRHPQVYLAHSTSNYSLFTTRLSVARELEPDAGLRITSEFLVQHGQPGDQLAGTAGWSRISYLSGIPRISGAELPRDKDTGFVLTEERLQKWLDQGADWIVIRLGEGRTTAYWSSMQAARKFQQLHETSLGDYCTVFSTRKPDPAAQLAQEPAPTAVK